MMDTRDRMEEVGRNMDHNKGLFQDDGKTLLRHWAGVLHGKGFLKTADVPIDDAQTIDLPLAGALQREGVANRTLLIGPAGGFYSACAEDI